MYIGRIYTRRVPLLFRSFVVEEVKRLNRMVFTRTPLESSSHDRKHSRIGLQD